MKMNSSFLLSGILAISLTFTGCSDDDDTQPTQPTSEPNLAELVADASQFSSLEEALTRTGLDTVLGDGNARFTVFAPNDVAFNALYAELGVSNLDETVAAVGLNGLKNILLYHVVSGRVAASDLSEGYVETEGLNVNNYNLDAYVDLSNGVIINDRAEVISADITASNGIVHEVDQVILPLSVNGAVEVNPDLSNLQTALTLADGDLDNVLDDDGQTFTLFAPTNAAFDTLVVNNGASDLADLVASIGTDGLANVLLYHVLGSEQRAADLSTGQVSTAFFPNGQGTAAATFFVDVTNNGVNIIDNNNVSTAADVTATDITGTNGSVHIINQVLLPQ